MNLILRAHENVNDVTWSVVWCLVILLLMVGYYIVYIMRNAFYELEHGHHETTQQEELLQLPSDTNQ
jgi:hypothetical protein